MHGARRGVHHGEGGHPTEGGGQGGVLEWHAHPTIGTVGTCATFPFISFNCVLKIIGIAEIIDLTLQGVKILGIPKRKHYDKEKYNVSEKNIAIEFFLISIFFYFLFLA